MNNLQKLLIDYQTTESVELVNVLTVRDCKVCPAFEACGRIAFEGCAETRAVWLLAEYVEPDSWEKVRADVEKRYWDYWGCKGFTCDNCPAEVDGETPDDRLNVESCLTAQAMDIFFRIRALNRAEGASNGI